jgi:hypothetical protein
MQPCNLFVHPFADELGLHFRNIETRYDASANYCPHPVRPLFAPQQSEERRGIEDD